MKLGVPWKEKNCLTNGRAVSFIRKTLLHVVRRCWKWYEFETQSIRVTENKTRAIDPLCVATAHQAIGIHTSTFVMSPSPSYVGHQLTWQMAQIESLYRALTVAWRPCTNLRRTPRALVDPTLPRRVYNRQASWSSLLPPMNRAINWAQNGELVPLRRIIISETTSMFPN